MFDKSMEFYIFVYKACAVSLYTILVREVDGRFVTLFFNMSQNDLKRPNRILLIFSAIHIKSLAFRFATPRKTKKYGNDTRKQEPPPVRDGGMCDSCFCKYQQQEQDM